MNHCRIQRTGFEGRGKFWGPNLPPLSTFSTDLVHFILTLLNFDFLYLFSRFG